MNNRKSFKCFCIMLLVFFLFGCSQKTEDNPSKEPEETQQETVSSTTTTTASTTKAAPAYEYEELELTAYRGDNMIYGLMYRPKNAGEKLPTVIHAHGFNSSYSSGIKYAVALAGKGYNVYTFDFCGGSEDSESDGSMLDMTVFSEKEDLEAVISMLRGLDYVDEENIFLLGASHGGLVSAITAAENKDIIKGMILLYPGFHIPDLMMLQFGNADGIPETFGFSGVTLGRGYAEEMMNYDVYGHIAAYDKDVLILHGDTDYIVPIEYSERALAVYPSAELEVISGSGHGFQGRHFDKAVDYITAYLENHLSD